MRYPAGMSAETLLAAPAERYAAAEEEFRVRFARRAGAVVP